MGGIFTRFLFSKVSFCEPLIYIYMDNEWIMNELDDVLHREFMNMFRINMK